MGYVSIGMGIYLIHKGSDGEISIQPDDNVIDMEFTVVED